MAIPVSCPECFKEYNVKDDLAGSKIRCKTCHAVIEVGRVEESELTKERKKAARAEEKRSAKKKAKTQKNILLMVGAVLAALLLIGVSVAAYLIPDVRAVLSKVMMGSGVLCVATAMGLIQYSHEDEHVRSWGHRNIIEYIFSLLDRIDEIWPYLLLAFVGAIVVVAGAALAQSV